MEPRSLNTIALVCMGTAGVFWIGFQFVPSLLLLALGAVFYLVGVGAFVAFVVAVVDGYMRGFSVGDPGVRTEVS